MADVTAHVQARTGLAAEDLAAIAELEARTVAADGGRLKLEWGVLNSRPTDRTQDLLCFEGGELVGFLGLYAFGHDAVELAGMVDPAHRRRGIGSALLAEALRLTGDDFASTLLVCPRATGSGAGFASAHGGVFDHAEHAMLLTGPPVDGPSNPAVSLRQATTDDLGVISRLMEAGFGDPPGSMVELLLEEAAEHIVIELDREPVGYVRLTLHGERGGVYGFVVDPAVQGRGIGRDVLRRSCHRLREAGAKQIGLEVAVDNERALGLYTSIGFERVLTEDYFRLAS